MSSVLITGGAGFLGSHLCESFLKDGYDVIAMDNLRTGRPENVASFVDDEVFTLREQDVTEPFDVSVELEHVVHLASLASPVFYKKYPIETLEVGSEGTQRTLDLAREKDATFMFASTSEVYGDPEEHPQSEEYRGNVDSFGPRSCYDESKRYGEALIRAYRDQYGVDVRVARLFNTYGPRMRLDDGRVVPAFVKQALNDTDLTVHGDGQQTRSFCYVSDLIEGFRALLEADVQSPVNIGNPDERTIKELAEVIINLTDSGSGLTFEEQRSDDPSVRQPDLTKARNELDWEPTVDLETGLRRTIDHYAAEISRDA
jgi:dTDP-glucose 4,6-dehydratase